MLSPILFSLALMFFIWAILEAASVCQICGCDPCDCHSMERKQ